MLKLRIVDIHFLTFPRELEVTGLLCGRALLRVLEDKRVPFFLTGDDFEDRG